MAKSPKSKIKVIDGGKSNKGANWITDEEYLPFQRGKPRIFTTRDSNLTWQFSMWIAEEKKYYQKSLRTEYKTEALKMAEDLYVEIISTLKEGRKPVKITFNQLIEEFLTYQQERVAKRLIKEDRLVTIRSRMNALKKFMRKNVGLGNIKGEDFLEYTTHRQELGITDFTIKQERSEIGALFKWGLNKGYINGHQLPVFGEMARASAPKRDAFEIEEYEGCYRAIRKIIKDTERLGNQHKILLWKQFYEWFLICGNSGIRFAESRRLKWKHIRRAYKLKGENATRNTICEIFMPASITKTYTERLVISSAGDYVKRLKQLHGGNPPLEQHLFVKPHNVDEPLPKNSFYNCWNKMLEVAGLEDRNPALTPYSLRHFYATIRLMNKVDIYDLSLTMGCRVNYIETHYSHILTSNIAGRITKIEMDRDLREIIPI